MALHFRRKKMNDSEKETCTLGLEMSKGTTKWHTVELQALCCGCWEGVVICRHHRGAAADLEVTNMGHSEYDSLLHMALQFPK